MKYLYGIARVVYGISVMCLSLSLFHPAVFLGRQIVADDSTGAISFSTSLGSGVLMFGMIIGFMWGVFKVLLAVPLFLHDDGTDHPM